MKNQSAYHRIRRMKVTGGFLSGLEIEFHHGLNTVIGPQGSGKSAVVEHLRHGLNVMPGRDGDPLRRRATSMIEKVLAGGRVELAVETKDGMSYTISRSAGEDAVILNSDGAPLPPGVSVNSIFGAAVYSQRQIEGIAENPHYQLDLIDGFEVDSLAGVSRRISDVNHLLEANTSRILPLVAEKQNLEASLSQLDSVAEKLRAFDTLTGRHAGEINAAHALKALRGREITAIHHSIENLQACAARFKPWLGQLSELVLPMFSNDITTGPNAEIMGESVIEAMDSINEAEARLARAVKALDEAARKLGAKKEALGLVHIRQEAQFRTTVEKQQRDLAKSAERARLEKQRNELLFRQRRLTEVVAEITALETKRTLLRSKLSEVRDERFTIRQEVAERLNSKLNATIRIRVAQSADQEDYRRFLESALRDAGMQHQRIAASLSREISPDELADLVRADDVATLAQRGGINLQQATAVIRELTVAPRLLELQIVDLNEMLTIELCDNGIYKDSGCLSASQKCAAILPILLLEGNAPLIIDQPEDNLDNRFVHETVVSALKAVKSTRQVILVTHNPGIPVLGEASRVIVMQSDGLGGGVKKSDSVNGCGAEIVTLLDGGQDAFDLRSSRQTRKTP
ncbi:MAG: hypothetical protein K9N23_13720 [Akkermansiaceae bacterium]|nr:hypothetical protein [Akkermansiaceae bacterium]MCF7732742.1 hypothetical protein [Akkermansiaceae bacterium]